MPRLNEEEAGFVARELSVASDLTIYARSVAIKEGRVYFLGRRGMEKFLGMVARENRARERVIAP